LLYEGDQRIEINELITKYTINRLLYSVAHIRVFNICSLLLNKLDEQRLYALVEVVKHHFVMMLAI